MGNRAQRRSKDRAVLDYLLVQDVVLQYSVAIAMVLRDKLNFGAPKTRQTLKQIENLFDSINKDYVSIADCQKILEEECGIVFTRHGGKAT